MFQFVLGVFGHWLDTVDINVKNSKTIGCEVIVIVDSSSLFLGSLSQNGFSDIVSRKFMERLKGLTSNTSSNLGGHEVAHISNEISDVKNSFGVFLA